MSKGWWSWTVVLALGLWTLGCTKPPLIPPSEGGASWYRVQTDHFQVLSDLPPEQTERVTARLEEIYGLLGSVMFGDTGVPDVDTNAVIFEREEDIGAFYGERIGGVSFGRLSNDLEAIPTLVASKSLGRFGRLMFAHELTRRFNHSALGRTPPWLSQGLASYYATIRTHDGKPVLGETNPRYLCPLLPMAESRRELFCSLNFDFDLASGSALPAIGELLKYDHEGFYGTATEPNVPGKMAKAMRYAVDFYSRAAESAERDQAELPPLIWP